MASAESAVRGEAGITEGSIALLLVAEIVEKVAWRPVGGAGDRFGGRGASLFDGISRWEPRIFEFFVVLYPFYITQRIRRLDLVAPGLLPGLVVSGSAP